MIKFHCDKCDKKIGVPYEFAGKLVRCPRCKEGARVPQSEAKVIQPELELVPEQPQGEFEGESIWPDGMFDTEPANPD